MDAISTFFAMGGYAAFIWPAYALVSVVLIGLLIASLRSLRSGEADLETLKASEGDTAGET